MADRAAGFARGAALVRIRMPRTVAVALERLGCREVRGIRPMAGGQSWKIWWRVPASIWSLAAEDAMRVDDFPAFGGTEADTEPEVGSGEGR